MKEDPKSYIRFIHNSLSLCPGWGGASRLIQIVGRQNALQILLKAEKMNAHQAYDLGLVNSITTQDGLEGAFSFLEEYTRYNVNSTQAIKKLIASTNKEDG